MVTGFAYRSCQYLLLILLVQICSLTVLTYTLATPFSLMPLRVPSCHAHERSALLRFKDSFLIDCSAISKPFSFNTYASKPFSYNPYPYPYPKMKSWTGDECCSWDGVECNEETGHVIGLDLTSSCLSGTFPRNSSLFFSLSHLQMLSLAYNHFNHSRIPSEVGQLNMLQHLNLSNSEFFGQIPLEISKLSKLSLLDLSDDLEQSGLKLEDPCMERLVQNLTHLEVLNLNGVDISSPVPIILANLTSLRFLSLSLCNLYGKLTRSIFHQPLLIDVDLSENPALEGSLPKFQQNSPLRRLNLEDTAFSGEIPPSIGNLAHLEAINLFNCYFSGSIPSSLGNLTKLTHLDLYYNDLSADIPSTLTNLTQLQFLALSDLAVKPEKLVCWLVKLNKLYGLELYDMGLGGEIPSFLANFTSLTSLSLRMNQLTGHIPPWLMNLTQIEHLYLSSNQLMGPIPQGISQLENLYALGLGNNKLHGNFETLSELKYLQQLDLSGVKLTFPGKNVANNSSPKLKYLLLNSCNLAQLPQFLRSQDELELLSLENNSIHGVIPQWFVNATRDNLNSLHLDGNFITGFEQPVEVLPWNHLKTLDFSQNKMHGSLPIPPNSVAIYDVSYNLFDRGIPEQLCHASSLAYLDISFNNLGGQIPECISELGISLSALTLQGNNFHGIIPGAYPKSCQLKMINLSDNQLEGNVPRSLANCNKLVLLDIGKNHVNDTFPSWLGILPNLQILILRFNNFHGRIGRPTADAEFQSLRIIDLSHNFHTGVLPSDYIRNWGPMKITRQNQSMISQTKIVVTLELMHGWEIEPLVLDYSITITNKGNEILYPKILNVFQVVDFSSNNFTGRIPNSIGALRGLQALNLSNNNLDGSIPSSLTNMSDIESLDLSNNLLSGDIPQGLAQQLTCLEVFNVSYNHLVGPIPQGKQFNTFDNSSYEGNPKLCGNPLSNKCGHADKPPQQPPEDTSNTEDESSELIDWIIRTLGCVGGFAVGCAIGKYITDQNHDWFIETFGSKRRREPKTRVRATPNQRS